MSRWFDEVRVIDLRRVMRNQNPVRAILILVALFVLIASVTAALSIYLLHGLSTGELAVFTTNPLPRNYGIVVGGAWFTIIVGGLIGLREKHRIDNMM